MFRYAFSNTADMEKAFFSCGADSFFAAKGDAHPVFIPDENMEAHMTELDGQYIVDPDYRQQKSFEDSYDRETQSLMLECAILRSGSLTDLNWSMPMYLSVKCLDIRSVLVYSGMSAEEYEKNYDPVYILDFGTIKLESADAEFVSFDFDEPVEVTNTENNGVCQVLGITVFAGSAQWRLTQDGIEDIFVLPDSQGEDFRAAFETQLQWLNFYDRLLRDSYLTIADGSTFYFQPSSSCPYENGIATLFSSWDTTIDISTIESVCIMGQSYSQ